MCILCNQFGLTGLHEGDGAAAVDFAAAPTLSYTAEQAAIQITRDGYAWRGSPLTITYAFRDTAPASMPADTSGFSRFNATQITAALNTLQAWADVANITFVRQVNSGGVYSNNATILFGNYSSGQSGAAAFAYYPGSTSTGSVAGDVWINSTISNNVNAAVGNYGATTLVHEIGHALGLSHPGEYDATDGQPITYANDAAYIEDSRQYTVMSYFGEANTGGAFLGSHPAAPQMHDIAAIQRLYGANTSTRTGDTIYGFNSNTGRDWLATTTNSKKLVFAAWDMGGTDTFDFSGYTSPQTINLTAGMFSNVGGLTGNVSIAAGVLIENAIGGSNTDTINGNAAANILNGNGGNDTLNGGDGNDVLEGGAGNDTVNGGAGVDFAAYVYATAAVTVNLLVTAPQATGGAGTDTITGIENLSGSAFADLLIGDYGANVLAGGAGDDVLDGLGGDDAMVGGDGTDLVSYMHAPDGVNVNLTLQDRFQPTGGGGNDFLSGIESILGSAYDDALVGGAGFNNLIGGTGNDALAGVGGIDVLTGGAGADRFVYGAISDSVMGAADLITDFQSGTDIIDLATVRTGAADTFSIFGSLGYTVLDVDLGGNGSVDMRILLSNSAALSARDIVWNTPGAAAGDIAADDLSSGWMI